MDLTGFAVAGGRSLRMGRDKALMPWGAGTLLDHAIARLKEVAPDVRVLSGADIRYTDRGIPVVTDGVPGSGPLGGLLAALESLEDQGLALFLAVDLPHVPVALLRHLARLATGHDVVIPVRPRGAEPLCAVYRRSCVGAIRERLAAEDRKMTGFLGAMRVREVGEVEIARFGEPDVLLANVNTPEDYQAARERE